MKQYKIYKLIDEDTLEIRYIGVTTRTLEERLYQHLHDAKLKGTRKRHWIHKLKQNGKKLY